MNIDEAFSHRPVKYEPRGESGLRHERSQRQKRKRARWASK